MKINSIRSLYRKITGEEGKLFRLSKKYQIDYMNGLGVPTDNIERSYFQYSCQMSLNSILAKLLLNTIGFAYLMTNLIKKDRNSSASRKNSSAVLMYAGSQNDVPNSLKEEFDFIQDKNFLNRKSNLSKEDKAFIKKIWKRYPCSFYFVSKILAKIRMYRYEFDNNLPQAVLVSEEFSFTSSALTDYCRENGVQHINFMHGDKLFYIRDAFFCFDRCYVWDDYYKKLFFELHAEPSQFVVELPDSFRMGNIKTEVKYDFTYYLGEESAEELKKIKLSFDILKSQGYRVCVRPHPRYSKMDEVTCIFSSDEIQDTSISIGVSVMQSRHSVSLLSSVLLQSYFNGIEVVIDDLTAPHKYEKIQELDFICCGKSHRLLSEVLNGEEL